MPVFSRRDLLGALSAVAISAPARAEGLAGVAVILVHGKGGGTGALQPLAGALERQGAMVSLPLMSWRTAYRTYGSSLDELGAEVARMRQRGARKIVLCGHSLGANVSLGYVAARGGVAGVAALAPGHRPEYVATISGDSLPRAREMARSGRGAQTATFMDFNQGRSFTVTTTADAYLSFFEPDGPAGRAARASGVNVPILWVVGTRDRAAMNDRAPYSTGRRIVVEADHGSTPRVAVAQVVEWISSL